MCCRREMTHVARPLARQATVRRWAARTSTRPGDPQPARCSHWPDGPSPLPPSPPPSPPPSATSSATPSTSITSSPYHRQRQRHRPRRCHRRHHQNVTGAQPGRESTANRTAGRARREDVTVVDVIVQCQLNT